jgi:hypothetical protein
MYNVSPGKFIIESCAVNAFAARAVALGEIPAFIVKRKKKKKRNTRKKVVRKKKKEIFLVSDFSMPFSEPRSGTYAAAACL